MMKDKDLEQLLKAKLSGLNRLIDRIGPTPLRRALDRHRADMVKILKRFDQDLYEENAESFGGLNERFFNAHISEPGYKSEAAAKRWIAAQEKSEEYYTVRVVDEIPDEALEIESCWHKYQTESAVTAAIAKEHFRISKLLGLKVLPWK